MTARDRLPPAPSPEGFVVYGIIYAVTQARKIFNETPPKILYHYTTQAGLLGILQSKEIWATTVYYLNDEQEFRYALGILDDELRRLKKKQAHSHRRDVVAEMEQDVKVRVPMNVCVCSFSEDGDLLSQWRAYGGDAAGFSIGFSGSFLRSVTDREGFWLVRCIYNEEHQHKLVRTLLEDVIAENIQARAEGKSNVLRGGNLGSYLNRYAPILKHPSFAEEREWRIISYPIACTVDRFAYRPGTSMLIPYYRVPLTDADSGLHVEEIIVGPTPHVIQSRESVYSLGMKCGLSGLRLIDTKTPYRSW